MRALLIAGLLCGPMMAHAHFATLHCNAISSGQLSCTAGFSDESDTGAVILQVYDYDDTLINSVTTDEHGHALMTLPELEFYVVFDANHGEPAEFDYAELD